MSLQTVTARINGRSVVSEVPPRRLLADWLRDELNLTGTKISCAVQVCGACTVLVDGTPVSSCTYLAVDVDGRQVTTVEGLAGPDGSLSAVQQAFIDSDALQCGFCTPGFLLATTALLDDDPDPDDDAIDEQLEGNLCRCTGYERIREAVREAARRRIAEVSGLDTESGAVGAGSDG